MIDWWNGLGLLNQVFYAVAAFFSLIFLWQFISSLIGLSGGAEAMDAADAADAADLDVDADVDIDDIEAHSLEEAGESTAAFKIFSLRAILAFCTLFFWASALYLDAEKSVAQSLLYALAWGVVGGALVAVVVDRMRRLAESGTAKLATCVGRRGTVYLNIPADGQGEVRVLVSGRVTLVKARGVRGGPIPAGTPVQVVRTADETSVEVRTLDERAEDRQGAE